MWGDIDEQDILAGMAERQTQETQNLPPKKREGSIPSPGTKGKPMKAYGKERCECTQRKIRGTSMACPCCVRRSTARKSQTKVYKKRERQKGKQLSKES
jgi:hypothetical protein